MERKGKIERYHLPIIIEMDEDGYYIVSCPLFKGCHTYGENVDEALKNISEVIEMCLEETNFEELNKFVDLESWKFAKMPKLPTLNGKQLVKYLESINFKVIRKKVLM
jgi:predicted RNase H-like HicB family nuclease